MGMPGKPDGIDGSEVERYFLEGKIKEVADYCESDVVNTYRVWLRYELFVGRLSPIQHQFSEQKLREFIVAHGNTKIETELEAQKKLLKNSLGNGPVLAAAELELKALYTRQAVLKGNLKKFQASSV
jgi:hypothetical protein